MIWCRFVFLPQGSRGFLFFKLLLFCVCLFEDDQFVLGLASRSLSHVPCRKCCQSVECAKVSVYSLHNLLYMVKESDRPFPVLVCIFISCVLEKICLEASIPKCLTFLSKCSFHDKPQLDKGMLGKGNHRSWWFVFSFLIQVHVTIYVAVLGSTHQ